MRRYLAAMMMISSMVFLGGCLSDSGSDSAVPGATATDEATAEDSAKTAVVAAAGLITTQGGDKLIGNGGDSGEIVLVSGGDLKVMSSGSVDTVVAANLGSNPARITKNMTIGSYDYGDKEPAKGTPYFNSDSKNTLLYISSGGYVSDAPYKLATGLEIAEGVTATFKGNVDNSQMVLTIPGAVVINGTLKTKLKGDGSNLIITSGDNIVVGATGVIDTTNPDLFQPTAGVKLICKAASLLGTIQADGSDMDDAAVSGIQVVASAGSVYLSGLISATASPAGVVVSAKDSLYCAAGISTKGCKGEVGGPIELNASNDLELLGYKEINTSGGKGSARGGKAGAVDFSAGATLANEVNINALGGEGKAGGNATALNFTAAQVSNSGQIILDGGKATGQGGQVDLESTSGKTSLSGDYKISVLDGDGEKGSGNIVIDGVTPTEAVDGVLP